MPHKHKRRDKDDSHFDLPPSVIAKALPVRDQQAKPKPGQKSQHGKKPQPKPQPRTQTNAKPPKAPATSRRKNATELDTPKAFQRLMQYASTGKRLSGLDNGEKKQANKKRKREDSDSKEKTSKKPVDDKAAPPAAKESKDVKQPMPKILPGERLADFAARVDRELPLSAMTKSSSGAPKVKDHKMTKHEKHLRRLQAGWREEDAKIKEREQAEREEREAEMEEQLDILKQWDAEARGGKAKKKGIAPKKKKGSNGADDSGDDDPDPWAKLKKRDKERQANPFEVAQAPPQLTKPREIFKVRGEPWLMLLMFQMPLVV
ncbi:hypothetical protein N7539_003622 [Penicillium diatomitis]|uniref:Uncharacterized protein n=1 Tax=Penicillium diatomitis TaxID=2819901 RepID=A0A9W9XCH1_9EURO|nr:uncharacterized protein N7539_003622 [Penicillium diatomitis]KAJ5488732.1 hypothetical protein N7539_003622 [Penicillium diatomitis]